MIQKPKISPDATAASPDEIWWDNADDLMLPVTGQVNTS